jgi:hypothetical protein
MPNTARHHSHSLHAQHCTSSLAFTACPTLHVITGIHCMPNTARTSSQTHVRSVEMSPSLTRYSQSSRIHMLECTTHCSFHESFGLGSELPRVATPHSHRGMNKQIVLIAASVTNSTLCHCATVSLHTLPHGEPPSCNVTHPQVHRSRAVRPQPRGARIAPTRR